MDFITLIFIAVGLSVDSFAVSVSCGLMMCEITFWKATRIASSLAFFQALMPLIGWFIGKRIEQLVVNFDHWLAFGLLTLIGGKMIVESLKSEEEKKPINPLDPKVLVLMSLATSVDALIVGVTFALSYKNLNLYESTFIIGFTTFFFSMLGILFGKKTGMKFGKKMEILGGIILFLIGLKILLEHLLA
ncbi:MAG TPA: manganese efflux pump MntP family protein, partial [Bacteroidales bacterium]|nr:manganese efflux pump MntP family protein [Bacteroidales bacterium]